jgi:AcrR family transcriptional regulator
MPRINAATVAEHVAAQETAVVDAARRLFAERGVNAVSLADIAAEIGLSRTSLYRYFPTKGHILQRWFDQEMRPLVARSQAVVETDGSPADRLRAWLDVQLDFITDGSHQVLTEAAAAPGVLPVDVLADFAARHRELYGTLGPLLGAAGDPATVRTRTILIAGMVRSASDLARDGVPLALVRSELHRAALAVAAAG